VKFRDQHVKDASLKTGAIKLKIELRRFSFSPIGATNLNRSWGNGWQGRWAGSSPPVKCGRAGATPHGAGVRRALHENPCWDSPAGRGGCDSLPVCP